MTPRNRVGLNASTPWTAAIANTSDGGRYINPSNPRDRRIDTNCIAEFILRQDWLITSSDVIGCHRNDKQTIYGRFLRNLSRRSPSVLLAGISHIAGGLGVRELPADDCQAVVRSRPNRIVTHGMSSRPTNPASITSSTWKLSICHGKNNTSGPAETSLTSCQWPWRLPAFRAKTPSQPTRTSVTDSCPRNCCGLALAPYAPD